MTKLTANDFYNIADTKGISTGQQEAIIALYGFSVHGIAMEKQPFVSEGKWRNILHISSYTMNRLWKKGLIERKRKGEWAVRLSAAGYSRVEDKKRGQWWQPQSINT